MNPFLSPSYQQPMQPMQSMQPMQQQTNQQQQYTSSVQSQQGYQQQQQSIPSPYNPYQQQYGSSLNPSLSSNSAGASITANSGLNFSNPSTGFNNGLSSSTGNSANPYNPFTPSSIPPGPFSFPSNFSSPNTAPNPTSTITATSKQSDPFANLTGTQLSSSWATSATTATTTTSVPLASATQNPFDFNSSLNFTPSTSLPPPGVNPPQRPLNSYPSSVAPPPISSMGWASSYPSQQQQQQDQSDLIGKIQNISVQQKQMRAPPPVPVAQQLPPTQASNLYFQNGATSDPFSYQPPTPSYPFQATAPTTTAATFTQTSNVNTSNLFGDDDAGFFSFATTTTTQKPATSAPPQKAPPKAQESYEPPTEEDQRLLRRASLLFEQGIIKSKDDKTLLQDKLLQKNKDVRAALQKAEGGDHGKACLDIIKKMKNSADNDDDDDDGSGAGDSDDDGKSDGTMSDGESAKKDGAKSSTIEEKAPHPRAGGWTGSIPATLFLEKEQFCGNILMRISSKMLFRKWKPVFVSIDTSRIAVYPSRRDWEVSGPTKAVFMIHASMWVAKPSLKKTSSVADDGRRVFYTTVKENVGYTGSTPQKFSPALENRVVVKFGSYYPNEIGSIAYSIYSCVTYNLKGGKPSTPANTTTTAASSSSTKSRSSFSGGRYS